MIYIPTELTGSIEVGGAILVLSAFISIVFKQSATVSILVAKVLVALAMKVLNAGNKWSKQHNADIQRMESEWHLLKAKLKHELVGKG